MHINLTLSHSHCLFLDRMFSLSSKYESTTNLIFECKYQKMIIYHHTDTEMIYFSLNDSFFISMVSEPFHFAIQLKSFWINGMTSLQIIVNQTEMIMKYIFDSENKFTKILNILNCDPVEMPQVSFKYRIDRLINKMAAGNATIRIEFKNIFIKQKNELIEKNISEDIREGGCNLQMLLDSKHIRNIKKFVNIIQDFYGDKKVMLGIGDEDPLSIHITDVEMDFRYFCAVEVDQIFPDN